MHVVQAEAGSFFIDVEDAHVRGDAQHGLVMTITLLSGDMSAMDWPAVPRQSNWIVVLLSVHREAMTELLRARARGAEIVVVIVDFSFAVF